MDRKDQESLAAASRLDRQRRLYSRPALVEYGSVAKLTQTGGSTNNEGSVIAKKMQCL